MGDGTPRAALKEAPLPFSADAIDDSEDAYARLVQWVTYWSETLQVNPPAPVVVVWRRGDEEQGFRAEATPAGAVELVKILVTWMLIRWDAIVLHTVARCSSLTSATSSDRVREVPVRTPRRAPGSSRTRARL